MGGEGGQKPGVPKLSPRGLWEFMAQRECGVKTGLCENLAGKCVVGLKNGWGEWRGREGL